MATKKRTPARVKKVEVAEAVIPVAEAIPVSTTVTMIPVGSLQVGDQFEYGGERYRRLFHTATKVVALHLTNPEKGWIGISQTAFDRNTMVIRV